MDALLPLILLVFGWVVIGGEGFLVEKAFVELFGSTPNYT
jgi:hypothetical protein